MRPLAIHYRVEYPPAALLLDCNNRGQRAITSNISEYCSLTRLLLALTRILDTSQSSRIRIRPISL
jgi:hypothetical protein